MKIKHYYSGQFRRVLKHLIRIFGGFQVQIGYDDQGQPKFKTVPCRYANFSKQMMYLINGASENVSPSAPMMTISVQSLKIDRANIRSPMSSTTIMGVNESPAENRYIDELADIKQVERFNPVPWILVFDVHVWTTNTDNKLQILEQIAPLFNPSVVMQLSMNPMDWTSAVDIELLDCSFSSVPIPVGVDSELDIMTLTFQCPIWFSLPAKVTKPKLIQQIVANIKTARDELEIDLENFTDIVTDVYTPRNLCVGVERVGKLNNSETYEVTLLDQFLNIKSTNGKIFSWDVYFNYLEPGYEDKLIGLKFQKAIEDDNAIKADVISIGSDDTSNKLIVEIDTSNYNVIHTIKSFISSEIPLLSAQPNDKFINISESTIEFNSKEILPNYIVVFDQNGDMNVYPPLSTNEYVYNESDTSFYTFSTMLGWHQAVLTKYRNGYWRLTFKD